MDTLNFVERYLFSVLFTASLLFALAACGAAPQNQNKLPLASVSQPLQKQVIDWDDYPGRLESPQTVTLAARVSGIIIAAPFTEGAMVQKGDVLFEIDDRPFKADFQSKEAELQRVSALHNQAEAQFKRYEGLKLTKAISDDTYDQVVTTLKQTQANVAIAQASLDIARLNLEWTKVTAPISGKISRKYVTEGNLIDGGSGDKTNLTTITSIDPVYAYASVSERVYLQYRDLADGSKAAGKESMECAIRLENEKYYQHDGVIDFIDNQVDPSTGTIQMRCVLPNPSAKLTPGLYAKMRIQASNKYDALLIPDSAISTDQNSRYLLVVGKEDIVELRRIELGSLFGKLRSISSGIKPDDRVVITGLQAIKPGSKVTPNNVTINEDPAIASSLQAGQTGPV